MNALKLQLSSSAKELRAKKLLADFLGGAVVKNPPANAGFNPWPGKIPHATEQLSPCTTTTEPALYSLRPTTTEPAHHNY